MVPIVLFAFLLLYISDATEVIRSGEEWMPFDATKITVLMGDGSGKSVRISFADGDQNELGVITWRNAKMPSNAIYHRFTTLSGKKKWVQISDHEDMPEGAMLITLVDETDYMSLWFAGPPDNSFREQLKYRGSMETLWNNGAYIQISNFEGVICEVESVGSRCPSMSTASPSTATPTPYQTTPTPTPEQTTPTPTTPTPTPEQTTPTPTTPTPTPEQTTPTPEQTTPTPTPEQTTPTPTTPTPTPEQTTPTPTPTPTTPTPTPEQTTPTPTPEQTTPTPEQTTPTPTPEQTTPTPTTVTPTPTTTPPTTTTPTPSTTIDARKESPTPTGSDEYSISSSPTDHSYSVMDSDPSSPSREATIFSEESSSSPTDSGPESSTSSRTDTSSKYTFDDESNESSSSSKLSTSIREVSATFDTSMTGTSSEYVQPTTTDDVREESSSTIKYSPITSEVPSSSQYSSKDEWKSPKVTTPAVTTTQEDPQKWKCRHGIDMIVVTSDMVCDGKAHCNDGSDEADCPIRIRDSCSSDEGVFYEGDMFYNNVQGQAGFCRQDQQVNFVVAEESERELEQVEIRVDEMYLEMASLESAMETVQLSNDMLGKQVEVLQDTISQMNEEFGMFSMEMTNVLESLVQMIKDLPRPDVGGEDSTEGLVCDLVADGDCYVLNSTPLSFKNAEERCMSNGGHLASWTRNSKLDKILLMEAAVTVGQSNVWVGAEFDKSSGKTLWTDGSVFDIKITRSNAVTSCGALHKKVVAGFKCSNEYPSWCKQSGMDG